MSRRKPPKLVAAEAVAVEMPVLRIKHKPRRPKIPPEVRARVYKRDGYACVRCGSTHNLTIDHKKPWSKGGAHKESNFQTMCRSCNLHKGDDV